MTLGCQSGNVLDEDDFGAQCSNEAGGVNEQVGAPVAEPVTILTAERLAGSADDNKVEVCSAQALTL